MSGITNKVEHVADKFLHSGEPGTTGRENFNDTTGLSNAQHQQHTGQHGLGSGLTGGNQGLTGTGNHGLSGDHNGSGLTGNNHGLTGNNHGLTGNNHSGLTGNNSSLTGNNHSGLTGNNSGLTGNNSSLTGNNHSGLTGNNHSGLTGNNHSGLTDNNNSSLTGNNHGLTGDHNNNSSGLTGSHGSGSTGTTTGLLGNSKAQDVGSGVPTGGLTGAGSHNNHGLSSETTARSDLGQTGSHYHSTTTDHNTSGKPGLVEKVKDAVGLNKHDGAHHNTNTSTHGTHNSGTGSGLNTLSGGQNTTSTGLTGSSGHSDDNHATNNTAAALGAGSIAGGHHDSHSGLGHNSSSHTGTGLGSNTGSHTGTGLGSNTGSHSGLGSDHNRVGDLSQDISHYERTGASGPATSGAAGTDRFDTGKHHNTTGTGLTGTTDHGLHEGEGRKEKGTGGLGGLLTTTDKDFLGNRDRIAKDGAYVDTDKYAQQNISGPGGNSALTGREGTTAANPVAQAQAHGANVGPNAGHQAGLSHGTAGTGVAATHGDVDEHGNPKKKSIVEKIKDAIL